MKETSFRRCYINGKKSGVASYDNGECRVLFFSNTLGAGSGVDDLRAVGVSLHQFNNSLIIPSADLAGIQAVLPGAVVNWEGSKEYNTRVSAAAGSRGGSSASECSGVAGSSTSGASAPVVASADAFRVPALSACPALEQITNIMPALVKPLTDWASSVASAVLGGAEVPAVPETVSGASALVPALAPAVDAYKQIIINAAKDHAAKLAEIEAARVAAEKAAAAAANGKSIVTLEDGSTLEVSGKVHAAFVETCGNVKNNIHTYLVGPAGTGKTYLCKQVADALGLPFYSDQKISQDFQLLGFIDAAGKYQETALYKACINGGIYMLDEFDASDECAAVVLNTALANGFLTFPGVGRVDLHKDFHCIACGNTIGRGADSDYTGRNCLDAATLDRFAVVNVEYDSEIELKVAGGDAELVEFIHAVRAAVKSCGVSLVVSMRAIENITKVKEFRSAEKCLSGMLLKGLEKDQIALLANECKGSNKWFNALKALAA